MTFFPVESLDSEFAPPFEVLEEDRISGPLLVNSPHSGRIYPTAFLRQVKLDLRSLRRSEDSFVDDLLTGVTAHNIPLMRAHFPRCFVDVNREPYELDPRMFDGAVPSFANVRSMRVAGGLGTVPRVVGEGQDIYPGRIAVDEALRRIEGLYKPYHRALRRLLARIQGDHGAAILMDCHSMPSMVGSREERPRADMVIGDRYGTSCAPAVAATLEAGLRRLGYAVARNKPYAGGFITEHYGNPTAGIHAVQLEINRGLYMDERRIAPGVHFAKLATDLVKVAAELNVLPLDVLRPYRTAAE